MSSQPQDVISIDRSAADSARGTDVLVFPGFTKCNRFMNDFETGLASALGDGYRVHNWGNRQNTGGNSAVLEHARARLHDIFNANGGHKIVLVGHSLGGIIARELAREFPDMIDQVVTLGTPVREFQIAAAAPLYLGMQAMEWWTHQSHLAQEWRIPRGPFDISTMMKNWDLLNRSLSVTLDTGLHDADILARVEHPIAGVVVDAIFSETDNLVPYSMARIREDGCHRNHVVITSGSPDLVTDHEDLIRSQASIALVAHRIHVRSSFSHCVNATCLAPIMCPKTQRGMGKTIFTGGTPPAARAPFAHATPEAA